MFCSNSIELIEWDEVWMMKAQVPWPYGAQRLRNANMIWLEWAEGIELLYNTIIFFFFF